MKILVFSAKDDPENGAVEAQKLTRAFTDAGYQAEHLSKSSQSLVVLGQVAQFRIVKTPCVLIVNPEEDGLVYFRTRELSTFEYITGMYDLIASSVDG